MESKILGSKDSHKYFPNFVIKAFYGSGSVEYLNARTGKISRCENSKQFNVKKGFYTDENEDILNEEAEQKFKSLSQLATKLARSGVKDANALKVNPDEIYNFFGYQLLRDPTYAEAILQHLVKSSGLNPEKVKMVQEFQNEMIAYEKKSPTIIAALKENFWPVLEINYEDQEFICINTPIDVEFSDGKMKFLAASPRFACCLVDIKIAKNLGIDFRLDYTVRCENLDSVLEINRRLMAHAIAHEPHEVLGRNQEYLTNLHREVKAKLKM